MWAPQGCQPGPMWKWIALLLSQWLANEIFTINLNVVIKVDDLNLLICTYLQRDREKALKASNVLRMSIRNPCPFRGFNKNNMIFYTYFTPYLVILQCHYFKCFTEEHFTVHQAKLFTGYVLTFWYQISSPSANIIVTDASIQICLQGTGGCP